MFSALSDATLVAQLRAYCGYLTTNNTVDVHDLSWTLRARRSQLPVKAAFSASTVEQLVSKINAKLAILNDKPTETVGVRFPPNAAARILGIFTGQGAQWAAMGAQLIRSSDFVRKRVALLEESLASLPVLDRPEWRLQDEMLAGDGVSRISGAALSQPLCTALQIILVDLFRAVGITFGAVVGHSSGEIAAAYAAGFLSARDAIRVAYYRGLHARFAGNLANGQKGAMLAVGTSWEDAQDLVSLRAFKGRLSVAAHNSPANVTLSGDADAVMHAKTVFDEDKKFARLLKVDTAYHSHHMLPCGEGYVESLRACGIRVNREGNRTPCNWFSSVTAGAEAMDPVDELQDTYWKDNMTNTVRFTDAVRNAVASDEQLCLAIEVGPHPALKGPTTQIISDMRATAVPYAGALSRGINDVEAFSDVLGFTWSHLGARGVDFELYDKLMAEGPTRLPTLVVDLPSYQWNHDRSYWTESRTSRVAMRGRKRAPHEILGVLSAGSTPRDQRWTNVLKVSEVPWLDGHQLQGQTVFPAAGYVAMALEASRSLAITSETVKLFELHDLSIPKAITFEEGDNSGVETLVTLTEIAHHPGDQTTTANFSCYAVPVSTALHEDSEMELMAHGTVTIVFGSPDVATLSCKPLEDYNMSAIDSEDFYSSLSKLGYNYAGSFRGMSALERRLNASSVLAESYRSTSMDGCPESSYLVHPSTLDIAFQSTMLAYSVPGDGRLWSLHVPTAIQTVRVNPAVCSLVPTSGCQVPVCAIIDDESEGFSASINLFSQDGHHGMMQVEDLTIKPFAPASAAEDRRLFTYTKLDVAAPDGASIVGTVRPSLVQVQLATACERISYYYVRKWQAEITDGEWQNGQPHHAYLRAWVVHTLSAAASGEHPTLKKEWSEDGPADIEKLARAFHGSMDVKLLQAVGENIPAAVRGQTTILEHMLPDNMLDDFYKQGLGIQRCNAFLATMVKQITHRYPQASILEIGAGTGGATKLVLESVGNTMSSYTYTDISVGFFNKAAELFQAYSGKMTFSVLDIEKPPASQGYQPHSYDIIIASNVLHATASLQTTLENTRWLLKPGGYLMLLELTNLAPIRTTSMMGGLPGWWLGVEDGRKYGPAVTPGAWHSALRKTGFSGIDSITPDFNALAWSFSVMAAQAVDDRVHLLRRPLALSSNNASAIRLGSLVIAGNKTLESARIADELVEQLGRFCDEAIVLPSFPTEAEALRLPFTNTFINLVDIDTPIFRDVTTEKMRGLKRMLELAGHILWITHGAQVEQPYHMASLAFSRAIRNEARHLSLNHLDISGSLQDDNVPRIIAEHLLQQVALEEWESPTVTDGGRLLHPQPLLWSKEPEAFLDHHGRLKLPRLVSHVDKNARLNASRRVTTKVLSTAQSNVLLTFSSDGKIALVEEHLKPNPSPIGTHPVKVASSSLAALHVAADTFLFLGTGRQVAGKDTVLFLSTTNSSEVVPAARVTLARHSNGIDSATSDQLLIAVTSELLAHSATQDLPRDSHVVVHCSNKDRSVAAALSCRAAARAIRVTFVCDTQECAENSTDPSWIRLDARASKHVLRRMLRVATTATHVLDLTSGHPRGGALMTQITKALPLGCKTIDLATLCQYQSSEPPSSSTETLTSRLEEAVSRARLVMSGDSQNQDLLDLPVISATDIHHSGSPPIYNPPATIVHWPEDGQVTVLIRPLALGAMFSRNKTYVLVGLSGKIGQSLCEWMVSNGAGCVYLASRNPKVDQRWLDSFQGTSATVKVLAVDVTNLHAVEALVESIRASSPPIAGVANGAMVLNDALFSNMSSDAMRDVLGPKVDGSRNLDQVFYNEPLDFFVFFSSAANLVGNPGQSNYAAANGYVNSLARQRRRRGLAASTLDVGCVVGIGYVERAGEMVRDQLAKVDLGLLSESDLRVAFAETILSGYPDFDRDMNPQVIPDAVITTGINIVRGDEKANSHWFSNPLFAHCIVHASKGSEPRGGEQKDGAVVPVRQQVARAANKSEALERLVSCFSRKLRIILQISDEELDHDTPLVQLGIDSLVAVEVRSWFLKELKVDIPVLKLVGGSSVAQVCQTALEKLPEDLAASIGEHQDTQARESIGTDTQKQTPSQDKPATLHTRSVQGIYSDSGATATIPEDDLSANELGTPGTTLSTKLASSAATTPSSVGSVAGEDFKTANTAIAPADARTELTPPSQPLALEPSPNHQTFIKSEPVSLAQSRFWFLRRLLEDQSTYNVTFYYRIAGDIRVHDLEQAIPIVTARHEALRTCFIEDQADASQAHQKVLATSPIRLEHKTIGSVDDAAIEYANLKAHHFCLESGELLKLVLLTLSKSCHYLLISYHHIIIDGVSFQVLLSDLEKAYNGQSLGPRPRQYPEISAAQRLAYERGELREELRYWQTVFPTAEQPPVLPLLPMARTSSRVPMETFDTHQVTCQLEPALAARIKMASRAQRSTPFHLHLAAFKVLLFSFTNAQDLTIGVADAARNDSDVTGSIGFFLNLLPLRFRRQPDQRFSDAVAEARTISHGALASSRLPFDVLLAELNVERSSTHSPFFQAFLDYRQGTQERHSWGNCEFELQGVHPGRTAYDITLDVTNNSHDALVIIRTQQSLYDVDAADLLLETYVHLLDVLSSEPSTTLDGTPLFSQRQIHQALVAGRGECLVIIQSHALPSDVEGVRLNYG